MKIHKEFSEPNYIKIAYENVVFKKEFASFLQSLVLDQLLTENKQRTSQGEISWGEYSDNASVSLVTATHPMLNNQTSMMTVEGSAVAVKAFEYKLKQQNVLYERKASIVDKAIEEHKELNPLLWDKKDDLYVLKPKISKQLLKVANHFIETLKIPKTAIKDIVITGSATSYTYTKYSDLDLHLIVNMRELNKKYNNIANDYLDAKKTVWNSLHDISIKNIPIEIYVQDEDEVHITQGIYSVLHNKWIKVSTYEPIMVDSVAVQKKVEGLKKMIDNAVVSNKANVVETTIQNIKRMRKKALDKTGVNSVENLAFKVLRNTGYIKKLFDSRNNIFDRALSIEDEEWVDLQYNDEDI